MEAYDENYQNLSKDIKIIQNQSPVYFSLNEARKLGFKMTEDEFNTSLSLSFSN